jgi:hypothetical protein
MRQIHPVGFHEKFVASGTYSHYLDGELSGLVELWSIHELPDQEQIARIDWDGRNAVIHQDSMLLEALFAPGEPGEKMERLLVHAYGRPTDPIKIARVTYTFFDDYVQTSREFDNQVSLIDEQEWSSENVVQPAGTRLLMGFALARYALKAGTKVKAFSYNPVLKDNSAFEGVFCERIVQFIGDATLTIADKTYPARGYEGLTPDETLKREAMVWLDKHNVLLRHKSFWVDGDVILTQYARRPEPQNHD